MTHRFLKGFSPTYKRTYQTLKNIMDAAEGLNPEQRFAQIRQIFGLDSSLVRPAISKPFKALRQLAEEALAAQAIVRGY